MGKGPSGMTDKITVEEEIRLLAFDTGSVQTYAREGKLEEWVHRYLLAGRWANPGLSAGLKLHKRWWNGPVEVNLTDLSRVVGPETGMEYQVENDYWIARTRKMAASMSQPLAIPPLIIEYRSGTLSIRDGNTRYGAMSLLGWSKCWVVIWYNTESDFDEHNARLLEVK
jgi:hypothetical protein